jgi:hypothetical protein
MKQFAVAMLVVGLALLGMTFVGCGSNSSDPANINGTWDASLIDANNSAIFDFGTSLVVDGDGSLSITNFNFSTNSPCFVSGETEAGSFTLSGNFNGQVTGTFKFAVESGSPTGNTLALSGSANGNTISGTWSLTGGTGCTGSGKFTMTKM